MIKEVIALNKFLMGFQSIIKIITLTFTLLSIGLCGYAQNRKTDSLINVLKEELIKQKIHDLSKKKRIGLLQNQLHFIDSTNFNAQYLLLSQIFEEYRSFKFDSAFTYVNRMIAAAKKFKQKSELNESQILSGNILLSSGFYKEAFDNLAQIDTNNLSAAIKTDYLVLRARINAGIGDYDNDAYFSKKYHQQSEIDFKNAEITTPSNDFEKKINMAFLPALTKNKQLTPDFFYNFILNQHLTTHGIAMVATRISYAYTGEDKITFLALAAINDIRSSTKETLAIFLLGQELFRLNRTNDAYVFMQEAIKMQGFLAPGAELFR